MKLTKSQIISGKIILLFFVAMMSTFLAEYSHGFFGDWLCEGSGEPINTTFAYTYERCNYAD
jgi:hypothetical protein